MECIHLELGEEHHEAAALAFVREFKDAGETVINGSAQLDQMGYAEWLANCRRNASAETVRPDWAVATTFFAVRDSDERIVGMIDVRHSLATPYLRDYSGHIGYSVRPSERRKGYATKMLRMALEYCAGLGLETVRIGCYSSNHASVGVIERCGGHLAEEKDYLDGKPMLIFEVPTKPEATEHA
ncbi:MAG: GNAT family N-acetyltransferase [Coriobacteriales bacterium]